MIINVSKIAKEIKVRLPDLITRPVGRKLYSSVLERLSVIDRGETLLVDLDGIKVIDPSCIDEFLVRLIQDSGRMDFYIKLRNISVISEINIDSIFNSYSNNNLNRIVVIREELGRNNRYYIGPLTNEESDIIDYLRSNRYAGIEDIARFSGIEPARLLYIMEGLHRLRLVKKGDAEFTAV